MTGKGLERQGRDEFHGASGHDHWHFESGFNQQSDELDGLITGDSASDTEDHDPLFVGAAHEIKIADLLRACKLLPIGMFRSLVTRKFVANCHECDFCQFPPAFNLVHCCLLAKKIPGFANHNEPPHSYELVAWFWLRILNSTSIDANPITRVDHYMQLM